MRFFRIWSKNRERLDDHNILLLQIAKNHLILVLKISNQMFLLQRNISKFRIFQITKLLCDKKSHPEYDQCIDTWCQYSLLPTKINENYRDNFPPVYKLPDILRATIITDILKLIHLKQIKFFHTQFKTGNIKMEMSAVC